MTTIDIVQSVTQVIAVGVMIAGSIWLLVGYIRRKHAATRIGVCLLAAGTLILVFSVLAFIMEK